jgi:putative transposase
MSTTTVIDLSPQAKAWIGDAEVTIVAAISVDQVMVVLPDGKTECVKIAALSQTPQQQPAPHKSPDLTEISDADWRKLTGRLAALRRLAAMPRKTTADVRRAAAEAGISVALIYRLLTRFESHGGIATALLPRKRGPQAGTITRLPEPIETLVASAIEDVWLNHQQASKEAVIREVKTRCRKANLRPPSPETVRRRINAINGAVSVKARRGAKAAHARYEPTPGHYPQTSWPLEVIQIDHTPVDVIAVDQAHRRPIGRPYLTVAIDIHTRMVTGFLLSLEPPQATSVALCLAHAVIPKDDWLAKWRVDASWPVWGIPDKVHVDNGKEFHSKALSRGCQQYGVTLEYRPKREPRYGGHIERLIGTLMQKVHELPGTTFSNIRQRGDYKSEKHAQMTLDELQEWLTINIDIYHNQYHSGIKMPPLEAWKKGILGTEDSPGRGHPQLVRDSERFLIDFLPLQQRTVTKTGLRLFCIDYYSDVLKPLINDNRQYIVRYDPRDLSRVWLLSKDNEYYEIPYRNRHHPPISLWEHKLIVRQLHQDGRRLVDNEAIFMQLEKSRQVIDQAAETTKKARRQKERLHQAERSHRKPDTGSSQSTDTAALPPPRPFEVEQW